MRGFGLLILVILIASCVAKNFCGKTKQACIKAGGRECQPLDSFCNDGEVMLTGKQYCKKSKKCGCCAPPPDCSEGIRHPCEALNGTCISQDAICDGREITDKAFCKSPATCKCCFLCDSEFSCNPAECETEEGVKGMCSRYPYEDTESVGQMQCKDYCGCLIPNRPCNPPECKTEYGVKGICSHYPIDGLEYADGQLQCKDHCWCLIPIMQKCETEDGVEGKCSQDPLEGFKDVGQMQCEEGFNCWIPDCYRDPVCVSPDLSTCYSIRGQYSCPEGYCYNTAAPCTYDCCTCCKDSTAPPDCIWKDCKTDDGVEGICSWDPIENHKDAGQLQCMSGGCKCWIPAPPDCGPY